jgi:hypothetical protein
MRTNAVLGILCPVIAAVNQVRKWVVMPFDW